MFTFSFPEYISEIPSEYLSYCTQTKNFEGVDVLFAVMIFDPGMGRNSLNPGCLSFIIEVVHIQYVILL